ncbi:MAG: hypothetical protein JWM68_681 [Verrucomicrobiales bacterium]|nr:hypothetical protein [Verrucomicrobiales bacterium]
MTKQLSSFAGKFFLSILVIAFLASTVAAQAADVKLDLQLIWGTNDADSPNPQHKRIEQKFPFKWKNYFEVNRQQVSVAPKAMKAVIMSPHCSVNVSNLADGRIEVKLLGKGKKVRTEIHPLASGMLVIGGDATNDTSWFVVVKEVKP